MQIDDIVESVRNMSTEQIEEELAKLRFSRTQVKEVSNKKRPGKSADKEMESILDLFDGVDPKEIQKLLSKMGA